jgi:DNA-binding SARP family transcriptional activator
MSSGAARREPHVDVAAFEHALHRAEEAGDDERRIQAALEEAVGCYTGDLLPALYDEWILSARERLRSLFLQALDRLIVLLESQRAYTQAIAYAVQLLQHDPLHEATYRRLMRLYALNHDRTAALRDLCDLCRGTPARVGRDAGACHC